ncbi:ATP-binding cassette domain-containing protein [Stappia stellulata]|uniref:quaternary amine ABC transporter ATP-binding protein n=1 Tax=Stappia stellulata TaxID=71235 RepID=UPI001CD46E40|nr:ATP-binding cassette domain-containing protein [Stappia stellulata]MCA1241291.1 ATP-binding cassette domain-containing protein [Stappia stellulata]
MTNQVKVSIRHLYKIFGDDPVTAMEAVGEGMSKADLLETHNHVLGLRDINVDIRETEITVIMGLSGSGKSTLIRHFNRLIEPTAGEVLVDGENILEWDEARLRQMRRETMSMVFQKFALLPHRTVLDNAGLALATRGRKRKDYEAEAERWLERVGLGGLGGQFPHQLSGGMQQRVGIARALTSNAPIMLMDEAFSALDPLIRTDMQDLLIELQGELRKTIVFITHDLDEALKLADHLVILNDGAVVQQGEPQHILLNPADAYIADFVADIYRARVLRARSVMRTEPVDGEIAGEIDHNDNLESVIEKAEGSLSPRFRVMRDGKPVGTLLMPDIMRALVPRKAEHAA